MAEEITVPCPKFQRNVPVWYCTGSFTQRRERCPNLIEIKITYPEKKAERKCTLEETTE